MAVKCSKCGEELLGAVNRCWKCGQPITAHAESSGLPPVQAASVPVDPNEPVDAIVVDDAVATIPFSAKPAALSTSERIDAKRKSLMAMGGTIGSLVLAVFALVLAPFRFEAALIALLGLVMGIWGLYSPRRRLALIGMLLCWLGIGLGTYTGVRQLYVQILKSRPVYVPDKSTP